jgi:hypothetical protein
MSITTTKYYLLSAVTLLVGLSLSFSVAESAERLSTTSPAIKDGQKKVVPQVQVKSLPSSVIAGASPSAYPPPKGIFVSGTLSAVGPKVDTSQLTINPPKSISIQNSLSAIGPRIDTSTILLDPPKSLNIQGTLSAIGPRIDTSTILLDPPKNITVTTPLTGVGPR